MAFNENNDRLAALIKHNILRAMLRNFEISLG